MTGDIPAAALRLMASCPVRTHRAGDRIEPPGKRRIIKGVGRGGNQGGECTFAGRTYPNMKACMKAVHIGKVTFYKWVEEGRIQRTERG